MRALITPEVLAWARSSANISEDEAAHKAGVIVEKLRAWEKGSETPSLSHIRKLGIAYKRPIAVFYLPEPPKDFQPLRDFRRLPGKTYPGLSPSLLFEIREAQSRRDVLLELVEEGEDEPTRFDHRASLKEAPEALAEKVRKVLGVSLEKQAIRDPNQCFSFWRGLLEDQGVVVFQIADVKETEARGFSISESQLPVIAVNRKDNPKSRVFTAIHEFIHIMLKTGGLCDLQDEPDGRKPEEQGVEIFCNRVAGAVLVPENNLMSEPIVLGKGKNKTWSDDEIVKLANKYGVNREVVLRRLLIFSKTTKEFYEEKRAQYQKEYKEFAEREKKKKKKGFLPPANDAVSALGRPYVHTVLDAFHQERLTASRVSDYLGVQFKHVSKIEALIGKHD